ncbi:MAG: response regulator [Microbacterium sp.]|uniref:response regulator n=1 Tax=Microbacterium sp. TaxID=51671 RepID=UPI0039E38338
MAIARLHGGPLDGQVIPLADPAQNQLIMPYSQTQVVYRRQGEREHTGSSDGPAAAAFWFVESEDDINPDPDGRDA